MERLVVDSYATGINACTNAAAHSTHTTGKHLTFYSAHHFSHAAFAEFLIEPQALALEMYADYHSHDYWLH